MIKDNPHELEMMRADMETVSDFYRPSNYWNNYQQVSYNYIQVAGISRFRSNKNKTWSSFGAVTDPLTGYAQRLLEKTAFAESESTAVQNFLAQGKLLPEIDSYLHLIRNETHTILQQLADKYRQHLQMLLAFSYHFCQLHDHQGFLSQIEDAGFGSPDIIQSFNGRQYTISFLRYFFQYLQMAKLLDFNELHSIVEVGGGYGGLAEVILKLHPHITYVGIEIPPQSYISQQYLTAVFPGKTLNYSETRNMPAIDMSSPPGKK